MQRVPRGIDPVPARITDNNVGRGPRRDPLVEYRPKPPIAWHAGEPDLAASVGDEGVVGGVYALGFVAGEHAAGWAPLKQLIWDDRGLCVHYVATQVDPIGMSWWKSAIPTEHLSQTPGPGQFHVR